MAIFFLAHNKFLAFFGRVWSEDGKNKWYFCVENPSENRVLVSWLNGNLMMMRKCFPSLRIDRPESSGSGPTSSPNQHFLSPTIENMFFLPECGNDSNYLIESLKVLRCFIGNKNPISLPPLNSFSFISFSRFTSHPDIFIFFLLFACLPIDGKRIPGKFMWIFSFAFMLGIISLLILWMEEGGIRNTQFSFRAVRLESIELINWNRSELEHHLLEKPSACESSISHADGSEDINFS